MPRSLAMLGAETMLTSASMRPQQPASAAAVSGLRVQLGDVALVLDLDALDRGLGELAGEGAELLGEL